MFKSRELALVAMLLCPLVTLNACSKNPTTEGVPASREAVAQESVDEIGSVSSSEAESMDIPVEVDADELTMTTGHGKTMKLSMQTLADSRGYQYCELVFNYGEVGNDIYSTSPLAEASLEWWQDLDLKALAQEFAAESVIKNGPQWWSMDEVGVLASEPVPVAGVNMVFGAHLPPGTMMIPKYTVFSPAKTQSLTWKAGKPVYQLVDPGGYVYVLQGHKVAADSLAKLGEQFKQLPEGWEYRVQVPTEDLVMKLTPTVPIPSIQDEFDQIYIRIPQ